MFEAAVDRLCRPVGCAGPDEVGQHVGGAAHEGRPRVISSVRAVGTAAPMAVMIFLSSVFAAARSGFAVGGDDALVDAPGRLDLDVRLNGEHDSEPLVLPVGEQLDAALALPCRWTQRAAAG